MIGIPEDSSLAKIQKRYFLWKRFKAEMVSYDLLRRCLLLCIGGKGNTITEDGYQAFAVMEMHAEAFIDFFKTLGLWAE